MSAPTVTDEVRAVVANGPDTTVAESPGSSGASTETATRNRLAPVPALADLKLDVWSARLTPLEALVSQFLAPGVLGAILFFMLDRTDWATAAHRDHLVGGPIWPAILGQGGLAVLLATFWLDLFRRQQEAAGQAGVWLDAVSVLFLGLATVWIGSLLWPSLPLALVGVACLARILADWQARAALGRDIALSSCGLAATQLAIVLTGIFTGGAPETQAIAVIACAVVGIMAEAIAEQPAQG